MVTYINQIPLEGKRVFIRADLNVPLNKDGSVAEDSRIRASLETIAYAKNEGAKVIVSSHLGRPDGKPNPNFSLRPVAERLGELLSDDVVFVDDCIGDKVKQAIADLKNGQVLLLENLRFYKEEEKNQPEFSQKLAELCDVYINDAFATAHRAHASTEGMTRYVESCAAGFTIKREIEYFERALAKPERPVVAVLGGAKISSKISLISNIAKKADVILLGGAMANTFFAAMGHGVGKSLYEAEELETARSIMDNIKQTSCELVLPIDVVVAAEFQANTKTSVCPIDQIPDDQMAIDIGPETRALFAEKIGEAKTVVWNGPMGAFETPGFHEGTYAIAKAMADSSALTLVGGGDTDRALHESGLIEAIDWVSTAGGAFLELLEGKELPGISALEKKSQA